MLKGKTHTHHAFVLALGYHGCGARRGRGVILCRRGPEARDPPDHGSEDFVIRDSRITDQRTLAAATTLFRACDRFSSDI